MLLSMEKKDRAALLSAVDAHEKLTLSIVDFAGAQVGRRRLIWATRGCWSWHVSPS